MASETAARRERGFGGSSTSNSRRPTMDYPPFPLGKRHGGRGLRPSRLPFSSRWRSRTLLNFFTRRVLSSCENTPAIWRMDDPTGFLSMSIRRPMPASRVRQANPSTKTWGDSSFVPKI